MQNLEKASSAIFLDLGGQQRRFEYSMWSIGQIMRLTGKNPMRGELDPQHPDDLAILVWGGFISSDPSLDGNIIPGEEQGKPGKADDNIRSAVEQVQKWMRFDRLSEISAAVKQAFEQASPTANKKK